MKQRILPALCLLALLLGGCSHAQTASDVLPFRDGDVQAVEVRRDGAWMLEVSDAQEVQRLLDGLRGLTVLGKNEGWSYLGAMGYAPYDLLYFTFHLADGQLYTAGLVENTLTEVQDASFENDVLRLDVSYDSEGFLAFLDSFGSWTATTEDNWQTVRYAPHYGYSLPGELPSTAYPYADGIQASLPPRPSGPGEVLVLDDADVVGLTVYCRGFTGDGGNYSMEVTDAADIAEILARMRAFQVWGYNTDGLTRYTGELYFAFHLTDGRRYTVGYTGACASADSMSFESDSVRLEVVRDEALMDFVRALDYAHSPSDPPRGYAVPPLGFSQPDDPLCTTYPYVNGSA